MRLDDTIQTAAGPLSVELARPEDLDALVEIDRNTSAWSRAIGFEPGEPPRPIREIFAEVVGRGDEMYVARHEGRPVAKLSLQWSDDLWHDLPAEAGYVHGLATHRDFAGLGVGLALLRWAEDAVVAAGKLYVRLDCNADNPPLRAYYERAGYVHRGDVALPHRTGSRYEKRVGTR
jgi:GNAT superfamily N-acetyltransferase